MTLPSFTELMVAAHGRPPYAWQQRAADDLRAGGWWPALRAPTGAGKTSLIDCWLHAVATTGPDRVGRRLVWVVDRRSVVDQVHAYASALVAQLVAADTAAPLKAVVSALRRIGGGADPRAVLWRGGLDDESAIAMRDPLDPAAVAVVVSTVDQLGSRLLFRGYGLGVGSRALHAGLLGVDTTVVLDEAHLSQPLRHTVARVAEIQHAAPRSPRPPLRLCAISATHEAEGAFELTHVEREEPPIARRLTAAKRAQLHEKRFDAPRLVRELAVDGAQLIGVVLNTVADARAAFDAVTSVAPEPLRDRVLLIGPVRPLDRADLLPAIPDRVARAARETPFVVVATQTIEVGVDLDFDALITACAPLDALVQRFGRLDRAGARGCSDAVILAPPRKGCPVYGDVAVSTWDWLASTAADDGVIDFGVEALRATIDRVSAPPSEEPVRALRLLDAHIDALTVTDATEEETPAVELFLHGDRGPAVEVAVAWRAIPGFSVEADAAVARELELRPLHDAEMLVISRSALRRWLIGEQAVLSDLEAAGGDDPARARRVRGDIPAWRVGADGGITRLQDPREIRSTDHVVIRADAGGLDGFGWSSGSGAPVTDLGSLAARGPRLVLEPIPDVAATAEALASGDLSARAAAGQLAVAIDRALPPAPPGRERFADRRAQVASALRFGRAELLEDGRVLVVGRGARSEHATTGRIIALDEHQEAVTARVQEALAALGIDGAERLSLLRAARHHDEGKRDSRFQAWLRGGRTVDADALAKGAYPYDPVRVRRLREAAGWPAGKRHELVSAVAVAGAHPDDRLAAWIVATHHGRNRPFSAAVADPDPGTLAFALDGQDVEVAGDAVPSPGRQLESLIELGDRHGPWGLAFLEALLISADRVVSASEGTRP